MGGYEGYGPIMSAMGTGNSLFGWLCPLVCPVCELQGLRLWQFKQINNTHGHKTGDGVLEHLSAFVSAHIRDIDLFVSWGGEEFVLMFPDVSLEAAVGAANKLRRLISEQEMMPGLTVICSCGVTEYQRGDSLDQLSARIDNAPYMAKMQDQIEWSC